MFLNFTLAGLSELLGASEPALRLLITILFGYPLAAIYRLIINKTNQPPIICHLYFTITGILLYYFNYGFDVYHSLLAILFTYIWLKFAYKSKYLVSINFIFHMTYLLCGYYLSGSDEYDIKWTMPHCVLTLRLIGFVFDLSDGQLPEEKWSNDQKQSALKEIPTLLELFGFSFFPGSFIVGPQFTFRRYKNFINKEYEKYKTHVKCGLYRAFIAICYIIIRQYMITIIPDNYLLSDEYKNFGFIKKLIIIGIWAKLTLYKYIGCWLLTEGALMCFGLTFNKITDDGKEDWSGCTNVRIIIFEMATKLSCFVTSFNVNTNQWVSVYVFKRLRFLGNRMISHALALLFLAVWHGFHSGYYMSFFFEFVVVTFERQVEAMYEKNIYEKYKTYLDTKLAKILMFIILQCYTLTLLGWCLSSFVYFNYKQWMEVYSTVNYFGVIFLASYFIMNFIYSKCVHKKKIEIKNDSKIISSGGEGDSIKKAE